MIITETRTRRNLRQILRFSRLSSLSLIHRCLLDVMIATLDSADLLSATRLDTPVTNNESQDATDADVMAVGDDYAVKINQKCPILKEKFRLKLQIERNLDKAFCNKVPGRRTC